jgi:hypothetical protein
VGAALAAALAVAVEVMMGLQEEAAKDSIIVVAAVASLVAVTMHLMTNTPCVKSARRMGILLIGAGTDLKKITCLKKGLLQQQQGHMVTCLGTRILEQQIT